MKYLLDTCVVSEMSKARPNQGLQNWLHEVEEQRTYLSVLVIGEVKAGIVRVASERQAAVLDAWFRTDLLERFQGRILDVTERIALRWADMTGLAAREGINLPVIDSLMAATALVHGFIIVTRNVRDFARCNVGVLNPWT